MRPLKIILLLILLILTSCSVNNNNFNKIITVEFEVDGKKLIISDKFKVYFLQNDRKLEAQVKGISLMLPQFSDCKNVSVFFKYDNYKLDFKDVEKSQLLADQDMEWDFEILNKGLAQIPSSIDSIGLKKVYVWGFNPQEEGDGIEIDQPIYR